jgi:hypothetical protein
MGYEKTYKEEDVLGESAVSLSVIAYPVTRLASYWIAIYPSTKQ